MKARMIILFLGIVGLWMLTIIRAAYLQLIPDSRLNELESRQFQTIITLQNRRGPIIDTKGRELALSTRAFSLYADPKIIESPKKVSKIIAKELNLPFEGVYQKLTQKQNGLSKRFVWISRFLPQTKYEQIKDLEIKGLSFIEEFKRSYPNEELLSQTLGFVGSEGQGLEGIELSYNEMLHGDKKKITARRDARGRPLIFDGMMLADNPEGAEIKLTINSEFQHELEKELTNATSQFDADSAVGVILNAKTSAILAMGSTPVFDINKSNKINPDFRRNKAITDAFEPGSTLKTFSIALALKDSKIAPNTKFNTEDGVLKINNRTIREAESNHKWKELSVSDILAFSSNIGITKIAFELGPEKLRKGLEEFGFGSKSGIDLPGENKGILLPLPWNAHLLSNISFGQGIAVTPLQMANAYAAIANGGILNKPYIVQSIKDFEKGITKEIFPQMIRRVLSPEDALNLRLMLMGVTSPGGTGINAKVNGFIVGGKTGTAQKVNPLKRGYIPGAYVSSFAGFIPAQDPLYVIYIAVDHPKKNAYYGSQVAAPIFSRLASYIARSEGLAPVLLTERNLVPTWADSSLPNNKTSTQTKKNQKINLDVLPQMNHLTVREVLKTLKQEKIKVQFIGEGRVIDTNPIQGTPMKEIKELKVYLR